MKSFTLLAACSILQIVVAEAYDTHLVVNDSNGKTYSQNIYSNVDSNNGTASTVIGEMYQDDLFDVNGTRVGTHQGFAFNFDNGTQFNSNGIIFTTTGEVNFIDSYIVSATGEYAKYQDGTMPNWNVTSDDPYIADVTMIEPTPDTDTAGDKVDTSNSMAFRITSEGGYYSPISMNGNQIGEVFQNPIISLPDSTIVGINQGYSFQFPQDEYITKLLGGTPPLENSMSNRQFIFNNEEGKMIVLNKQVLHATGMYIKYSGATLSEDVISEDPNYVADITVTVPSTAAAATDGEQHGTYTRDANASYDFRVTSEGGFYDPITSLDDNTGEVVQIGERFQNPVYNSTGDRIGTNQGFGFDFPTANYTTEKFNGNRVIYLEGGTLGLFNEVIVSAGGIYREYAGGKWKTNLISEHPIYVAEISLIPPVQQGDIGSNDTVTDVANIDVDDTGEGGVNDKGGDTGSIEKEGNNDAENGAGDRSSKSILLALGVLVQACSLVFI
mmetsp:Transcript_8828/g.21444  ORF Transcript_8828/g.21444 Transcript_8828/m.21444 type:complete len:498 (-) Transcript_8828:240-1733(-)